MHRLAKLGVDGGKLSDRIESVIDGENVWTALFALGVTGNMVAVTDAVSIEQNATESLYAHEIVKQLISSAPEELRDPLCLARVLANCLSHVAAETVYSPTSSVRLAERRRVFEVN